MSPSSQQKNNEWTLATNKHYKIWFSKDPNVFLPTENKIRCIRFKLDNPNATLSLVYSSKVLSSDAIKELIEFSTKLNIQIVDFDTDIAKLLTRQHDKWIYKTALSEITNAVNDNGGSLAAASDCVRLLSGVIEQYGIYSDLDVEVHFSALPLYINIKSPVIFPTTIKMSSSSLQSFTYNNEFLGFACNGENTQKMAPEALNSLRCAQTELILRYHQPLKALTSPVIRGLHTSIAKDKNLSALIRWYSSKNSSSSSIYDFRKFIKSLTIRYLLAAVFQLKLNQIVGTTNLTEFSNNTLMGYLGEYIRTNNIYSLSDSSLTNVQIAEALLSYMKRTLFKASVMYISGPFVTMAFLNDPLKEFDLYKTINQDLKDEQEKFFRCINNTSPNQNGLSELIIGQDTSPKGNKKLNDESWTPKGAYLAKIRSDEYLTAILHIQRAVKAKLDSQKSKENEHNQSVQNMRKI